MRHSSVPAQNKHVCICHRVILYHTERSVPTQLKKRCPEVGCPFPTSSPFQWLEIPLRTKRPDMIPQHCRPGRERRTVLIWEGLLSGKVLKGLQPIVVNCMRLYSVPSTVGMCYSLWIGGRRVHRTYLMINAQVFVLVTHGWFTGRFPSLTSPRPRTLTCNDMWTSHVGVAWLLCVFTHCSLCLSLQALSAFTHLNVLLKGIYWHHLTLTYKLPLCIVSRSSYLTLGFSFTRVSRKKHSINNPHHHHHHHNMNLVISRN